MQDRAEQPHSAGSASDRRRLPGAHPTEDPWVERLALAAADSEGGVLGVGQVPRLVGDDLKKGDIAAFGQKMFATHEGLSKKYEVSCPEADFLVEQVKGRPGVIGARMMGGGFGGCTINLVREEAIDDLVADLAPAYARAMNKELKVYIGQIENGTSLI